jgi:uncharacterized membrane protein YsdA (DUF1294 family)
MVLTNVNLAVLNPIFYLLFAVNITAAILFIADKRMAVRKGKRISESAFHFFELLGGVFFIVLLMPVIRHKNKKRSYWAVSVFILTGWIFLLGYLLDLFGK